MFRRFCQASFAKLKSLEFGNDLTPSTLKTKLDLCAESLERAKFVGGGKEGNELLSTFAKYSYPRLVDMEFDIYGIEDDLFPELMDRNRNLKRLKWLMHGFPAPVFPKGTFPNLESLEFQDCYRVATMESMLGKLPNLKSLRIDWFTFVPGSLIDEFLGTVPKLEVLHTRGVDCRDFENFWKLNSLTDLSIIKQARYYDKHFVKLAESFPRLRNLKTEEASDLSIPGIKALATLKELRELELWHEVTPRKDVDNAFENFAACKHLEIFRVHFDIRLSTIFTLIRNCPALREISVQSLLGADSSGAIAAELLSLSELGPRNIDFKFSAQELDHEIWGWDPVKAALEKLKSGGFTINIIYGDHHEYSYSFVLADVGGYKTIFGK